MNRTFTKISAAFLFVCITATGFGQTLGIYEFTGTGACPNQNPNITAQPSGATFSAMSNTGGVCVAANNVFNFSGWDPASTINLATYNEFTLTADNGMALNLDSLNFACKVSSDSCMWYVRSSLDNFATNLFTGESFPVMDTIRNGLSAAFSNISAVTFRFYVSNVTDNLRTWRLDDVTVKGSVGTGASIQELSSLQLQVYPNPGTEQLQIRCKANASDLNVKIFTSGGKLVQEKSLSFTNQNTFVDTKSLEAGIYFIQLSDGKALETVRWVKN